MIVANPFRKMKTKHSCPLIFEAIGKFSWYLMHLESSVTARLSVCITLIQLILK